MAKSAPSGLISNSFKSRDASASRIPLMKDVKKFHIETNYNLDLLKVKAVLAIFLKTAQIQMIFNQLAKLLFPFCCCKYSECQLNFKSEVIEIEEDILENTHFNTFVQIKVVTLQQLPG